MDQLEFPRLAYKLGGEWALDAGKFSVREVTAEEYEALQSEGWRLDQYAAAEAGQVQAEAPEAPEALPTREQMEADATSLGVKFDGRTSDKKLASLIAEATKV